LKQSAVESVYNQFPVRLQHKESAIESLREITKSSPRVLEYKVKGKELEMLKTAERFKEMCLLQDGIWTLQCHPNGQDDGDDQDAGWIGVYFGISHFPEDCVDIQVKCSVGCRESGHRKEMTIQFAEPDNLGYGHCYLLPSAVVQKEKVLTLYAEFYVLNVRMKVKEQLDPKVVSNEAVIAQLLAVSRLSSSL